MTNQKNPTTEQPAPENSRQMTVSGTSPADPQQEHEHGVASRIRGGGAGKDCFLALFGCFLCFECCEGCCDCCGDIICCPCELCC